MHCPRPAPPAPETTLKKGGTTRFHSDASGKEVEVKVVTSNSTADKDEILAPMGGVRESGWGRTGPRSLDDFSDVIWINPHSGQRQYPFLPGSGQSKKANPVTAIPVNVN